MGLFLIVIGIFTFGTINLEQAYKICKPEPISKECYIEAIQPIKPVDYSKLND